MGNEHTIQVVLDVTDDKGIVVDRTTQDLTTEQVQDIVANALLIVETFRSNPKEMECLNATLASSNLAGEIAEMGEALDSYGLI